METQLKIEVGKFYRTRNNKKARVYATDAGREFAVHGAIYNENINAWVPHRWHISGREYSQEKEFDFDLICEWEEPLILDFDPTCLPAWANWIAMNENRYWYFFRNKPKVSDGFWGCVSNSYGFIPPDFAPKNFKLNWESSLFSVEELKIEMNKAEQMPETIYAGNGIYLVEDKDDPENKGPLWDGKIKYHRADIHEALKQSHDRLVGLVDCLFKNDPDDTISDAGHTVLQLWRHDAEKALAEATKVSGK